MIITNGKNYRFSLTDVIKHKGEPDINKIKNNDFKFELTKLNDCIWFFFLIFKVLLWKNLSKKMDHEKKDHVVDVK